ncbi:MAG: beta-lactamase family protein [Bacteroidales bacterium]|nr:beta-lactamase family protein [Bacteroidales bacterium]
MTCPNNTLSRRQKIILLIIGALALLIGFTPRYVFTAIAHGNPDIDDYKIFYNRTIPAGEYLPWKIAEDYNLYELPEPTRTTIESYKPVAFLVIQDEKIKYEEYWDGYGRHSLSNSFSAGKSIVGLLVGIALDEGKIKSLDQPVGDFLPAFTKGENAILTIRNLLTMSSGLNWDETYTSPLSMTTEAYYGTDLPGLINSLKVVETPGKEFDYLSGNTEVLAMILEAATGKRLANYASEKIWKHIGARYDALWCLDSKDGMEKAYCCFNTNARDFARFGQLVLNNGKWNNTQIVSEKYLKEATSPAAYLIDKGDKKKVDFYGFQWWVIHYKGHTIPYMRGILGQYIFAIPDRNAVVVRLGHERSKEYIGHHTKDIYQYLDAAFKILD